jgi:hypothetical protein
VSASRAAFESLLMDLRPTDRIFFGSRPTRQSYSLASNERSGRLRCGVVVVGRQVSRSSNSRGRTTFASFGSKANLDRLTTNSEKTAREARIENGANESSERRANEPNSERATNATLNSIIRPVAMCLSQSNVRPQIRRENPPNLSILLGGGKEINEDFLSNGE